MKLFNCLRYSAVLLFTCHLAHAANTVDPDSLGSTDVVQDPDGTPVTLSNPLLDPLSLGADNLAIGNTGNGELSIDAGSSVSNAVGYVGYQSTSVGIVTVEGANSVWTNTSSLNIGYFGSATLNILDGGEVTTATTGVVATQGGSDGIVNVQGLNSTWAVAGNLFVGGGGTGTLNIENGGTVTNAFTGRIGSGGVGFINVLGADSSWTSSGGLVVGQGGNGTLSLQNGGSAAGSYIRVADLPGSTGSATVDGAGSIMSTSGWLSVGGSETASGGTGTLDVTDGGAVNIATITKLWAGGTLNLDGGTLTTGSFDNASGGTLNLNSGTLTIDGGTFDQGAVDLVVDGAIPSDSPTLSFINGATTANVPNAVIGDNNQGTLNILSGSSVTSQNGTLGNAVGSNGTATLVGVGANWTNTGNLYVGNAGEGSLAINNGATVSSIGGSLGEAASSYGEVTVLGAGSTWDLSPAPLTVGNSGIGVLYVLDGGTVASMSGTLGTEAGSAGTAFVDGAGSSWTTSADLTVGMVGYGELNITGGGIVTSASGHVGGGVDISQVTLTGIGVVHVDGTGSAWNNSGELHIGDFDYSDGTLLVTGGGTVTNTDGYLGRLFGSVCSATVDGAGSTWTNSGSLFVGSGGGYSSTLTISNGGLTSVADATVITGSSTLQIDGGTLATGSLDITFGTLDFYDGDLIVDGGTFLLGLAGYTLEGADALSQTTLTLQNGAAWNAGGGLTVARDFDGTLNILNGGSVSGTFGNVADQVGSTGMVTVDGAGSTWTNSGFLSVGIRDSGTLSITNGGVVSDTEGRIGLVAGATGTVTVDGLGSTWFNSSMLTVGSAANGALTVQNGGTVINSSARLGISSGGEGAVTVDGTSSTWTNTDDLFVGDGGDGTLDIQNGGAVSSADVAHLGSQSGATGIATVTGAGSTWTNGGVLSVGYLGNGTLNILDGGSASNTEGYVGREIGSSGTATVSGAGSTWNNTAFLRVAKSGVGSLDILDGGHVTSSTYTYLGHNLGSDGTIRVDGTGSLLASTNEIRIGVAGQGTLDITGGGSVTNTAAYVGDQSGSIGTVTVDGAGSSWTNSSDLYVGENGTGTLNISDGGVVSDVSGVIGRQAASSGIVTVNGGDSTWTHSNTLNVGNSGSGTLSVQNGGSVTSVVAVVGRNNSGVGAITVDGAGSTWTNSGSIYLGGSTTAAAGTGTLSITNGGLVAVAGETKLWGSGDVITIDGGTLQTGSFIRQTGAGFSFPDGELIVNGGTFDQGSSTLEIDGLDVDDIPTLTLKNGASANNSNSVWVGYNNQGSLNVLSGSTFTTGQGLLGLYPDSTGTVVVDGTSSSWTLNSSFQVGGSGNGTLTISNGGRVATSYISYVAAGSTSTGSVTVDGAGSAWTNSSDLYVGYANEGMLSIQNGGAVSNVDGYIGRVSNATGTVTVDGAGSTWVNSNELNVGYQGSGTLTIQNGGAVSNRYAYVGREAGSSGTVTVSGAGSTWSMVQSSPFIGYFGEGTLAIYDGGNVSSHYGYVGYNSGATGAAIVDGADSNWTLEQQLYIGVSGGYGSLTILGGGSVSSSTTSSNISYVGYSGSSSRGVVTVSGVGSTWTNSGDVYVGGYQSTAGASGNLSIHNGGLVEVTNSVKVWATGQVNLAAGTINAATFELAGGSLSGFGTVNANVSGGSTITATSGVLTLGNSASTTGFAFTGSTIVTNSGTLELLDADSAELGVSTQLQGGALVARNGATLGAGDSLTGYGILIGDITGSGLNQVTSFPTGTVDFRGMLHVGGMEAIVHSQGRPTINGTLTFNGGSMLTTTNSYLVGSNGTISGDGILTGTYLGEIGSTLRAERLTLRVGNSLVTNGFYSNGTLEVAGGAKLDLEDANDAVLDSASFVALGSAGSSGILSTNNGLTLDFGANVTGYGTISTPNNPAKPFTNNGHVAGNSLSEPITLAGYVKGVGTLDNVVITGTDAPGFSPATVNRGSVTYDGVLEIEIGGTSLGSFDRLQHILGAGIATLGGTLDVSLLNGFAPSLGDTFEIITASSIQGTFANVVVPQLNGPLAWSLNYNSNSVSLAAILAGDFDLDGDVDGRDFLIWQRNPTVGILDDWQANYGFVAPLSASSRAVPEPNLLLLGAWSTCGLLLYYRRSRIRRTNAQ